MDGLTALATGKRCSRCRETKPLDDFYRSRRYGRQANCKACSTTLAREHEQKKAAIRNAAKEAVLAEGIARGLKDCRDCGETKPFGEFAPTPRGKYGRAAYCHPCMAARYREVYTKAHAKQRRKAWREWRANNLEWSRERARIWNRSHPESAREASRRRRAREANAWHPSGDQWAQILAGDPCSYCGEITTGIDHVEPLHAGGPHHENNLTACCPRCNSSKRTKPLLYFLATR